MVPITTKYEHLIFINNANVSVSSLWIYLADFEILVIVISFIASACMFKLFWGRRFSLFHHLSVSFKTWVIVLENVCVFKFHGCWWFLNGTSWALIKPVRVFVSTSFLRDFFKFTYLLSFIGGFGLCAHRRYDTKLAPFVFQSLFQTSLHWSTLSKSSVFIQPRNWQSLSILLFGTYKTIVDFDCMITFSCKIKTSLKYVLLVVSTELSLFTYYTWIAQIWTWMIHSKMIWHSWVNF